MKEEGKTNEQKRKETLKNTYKRKYKAETLVNLKTLRYSVT